jgi:hypothetical protein
MEIGCACSFCGSRTELSGGWDVVVGKSRTGQTLFSVVALGTATQWENSAMREPAPKPRDEWPPGTIGSMHGTVGDRVPTVGQTVARSLAIQRQRAALEAQNQSETPE